MKTGMAVETRRYKCSPATSLDVLENPKDVNMESELLQRRNHRDCERIVCFLLKMTRIVMGLCRIVVGLWRIVLERWRRDPNHNYNPQS